MARTNTDDKDEIEYNEMIIPRTIGEERDDEDYDDLELGDDDLDDDPRDGDDPRYQALQEQMTGLQSMMQQQGQFYQTAFAQLMANGQPGDQADAGADGGAFNLEDLPDPVEDRAGFNKALQNKVMGFVDTQVKSTENRVQTGNLEQDLTNRFYRDHPELAKKSALFRAAVTEEANILKHSGVNAASSISSNPDAFLDKVVGRMNNELGIDPDNDNDAGDDGDEPHRRKKPRKRAQSGNDSSRARNLGRTSRPKRRGAPGDKGRKANPKGFINELRQQQAEMGLI